MFLNFTDPLGTENEIIVRSALLYQDVLTYNTFIHFLLIKIAQTICLVKISKYQEYHICMSAYIPIKVKVITKVRLTIEILKEMYKTICQ